MANESHTQPKESASVNVHTVLVAHKKELNSTPRVMSVTTLSKAGLYTQPVLA